MFPVFRVGERAVREGTGVIGTVTRTTHGREDWVGDGWIGFLKTGARMIAGRWHRRPDDLWEFAPNNPVHLDAVWSQREWEVLDGYWGERAQIVLDPTRAWDKARFQPTDAIRIERPAGDWLRPLTDIDEEPVARARAFPGGTASGTGARSGEVVEAGWDHEHCAICWETIGPGGQTEGYVSADRTWVCERCYVDFVDRRSLDFIPSA